MSLASGTKLGRYEVRGKIGEGGMGEVYRTVVVQFECGTRILRVIHGRDARAT